MVSDETVKVSLLSQLKSGAVYIAPGDDKLTRIACDLADGGELFLDDSEVPMMVQLPLGDPEEGERCPYRGCMGEMGWVQKPCTCQFTNPPCGNCTDAYLECDHCGHSSEELAGICHVLEFDKRAARVPFLEEEGSW
tara:strand:- start:368 stop:778 length:411 start_codon:yes stop_codon:yes gene_type:complete